MQRPALEETSSRAERTRIDPFEFPDLHAISIEDLRELIIELEAKERALSLDRRLHHGRIDLLRAELVTRLKRQQDPGD